MGDRALVVVIARSERRIRRFGWQRHQNVEKFSSVMLTDRKRFNTSTSTAKTQHGAVDEERDIDCARPVQATSVSQGAGYLETRDCRGATDTARADRD